MAAERLQRIVQVHPPQVFQSDDPIQLGECRIASRSGTQVVSGRKRMTGINADTHARLVLDLVDDIRQVFEPESQVGTLSGRVLDDGRDALRAVEGDIDRLGDAVQALLRRNSVQVAARMEIKTIEAEGLAAAHFVDEGRPGLLEPFALGMSQVDQVTVVRQDAPGRVTPGPAILSESRDLGRRQGRCAPLTLVFGKKGEAVAPILCAFKGAFSGPPAALTCAPKYFILFALSYYLSFC